jgi:hypothetical protein
MRSFRSILVKDLEKVPKEKGNFPDFDSLGIIFGEQRRDEVMQRVPKDTTYLLIIRLFLFSERVLLLIEGHEALTTNLMHHGRVNGLFKERPIGIGLSRI